VLEQQWTEQRNKDHLVQPAVPTTEFETLEGALKAHLNLDKGKRERDDNDAADDLE